MAAAAVFEKSKNHDISVAVGAISTKFGTVMQFYLLNIPTVKNLKILKSTIAAAAILKN